MKLPEHFREPVELVLVLGIATALAFAPDAYLPMLARAFLVQWAAFLIGVAIIMGWRRHWWTATGSILGALLLILQLPASGELTAFDANKSGIRVMHMNVLQPNIRFEQVIGQALQGDADIVSVQEVSPEWAFQLGAGLRSAYPYMHVEPRTNCYGIALFSKRPFKQVGTVTVMGAPFIEAIFEEDGTPFRVLVVHTTSPISYAHFQRRNAQFEHLAEYLSRSDTATVLIGDLNTVPWDHAFQRFCASTELRPISKRIQLTWPSLGPFSLIPLDHLLVSAGLVSTSVETFPIAGSDHRGLMAEIRLGHAR
ncbi:MAG TPA: endonuclease/exonuclease/phosphatase family protein [Flavobacteriales bacterium]|nr:endonuclease/exonuclease/phosphatase family protein [Flavobacteriales bacterium]